ncbi:zinc finger protein 425-like isoform X2 [Sipha flava]|uniref:Zinc finger protein 425-like isoform X2 n=1 Tax=Sipha flava TaxID=143950 RepID=A0A8B8GEK7_9HEMI|nr:zinc finger protein 425-like isoform X2 [Sipha flava]
MYKGIFTKNILHNNILRNRRHLCPNGCGRHYKRRCHMNHHLKFECGVQARFKCPYCFKMTNQKSNLKTHIRENQDRFICPNNMCCRTYKFKRNLSSHLKLECGGQKGFNCSICPKAFSQKVILKKHLAQIHNCIE